MASDVITIRASSTSAWTDCQRRAAVHSAPKLFADHGFDIAPPRSNIGALVGSGVHGAAEPALKERMLNGSIMPLSAIEDAGIEAFRARKAEEGEIAAEIVMDGDSPTMDDAEAQIRRMARRYRDDVLVDAEPVAVESRVTAEFMPGVELSGQADLLHLDGRDRHVVRDLKTGRQRRKAVTHAAQIGSYSLLFRAIGFDTKEAQIDYLARVTLKKPQPEVEPQPLPLFEAERVAHAVLSDMGGKLLAFADDGDPGRFIPNPSGNLCSLRFCRAFGTDACPLTKDS